MIFLMSMTMTTMLPILPYRHPPAVTAVVAMVVFTSRHPHSRWHRPMIASRWRTCDRECCTIGHTMCCWSIFRGWPSIRSNMWKSFGKHCWKPWKMLSVNIWPHRRHLQRRRNHQTSERAKAFVHRHQPTTSLIIICKGVKQHPRQYNNNNSNNSNP